MPALLLTAASLLWLALLTVTAAAPDGARLSSFVFSLSSFICHQQLDRTFHWASAPWPVCARCLGLYAAAPAGALAAIAAGAQPFSRGRNVWLLSLAALPTVVTWLAEHLARWPAGNAARFAAALPLGAAVTFVIARTLADARPRRVSQYTLGDARRG